MIDTFQISKTFARPPNKDRLREGWKPIVNKHTGEPTALCCNSAKGEPRLTLSRTRNDYWIIRAEVSLGSWLYGSNLHLPDEAELHHGLDSLSEYVESKSGIVFDAHTERVSRVDFTRDFQVGENAVIPIISKFGKLKLPRYNRLCFDETSVYFKNDGKERTKEFLIYSKHHERLAKGKDIAEQERAKGLIRLEFGLRKSAVNRFAKSLKLPNHHANCVLRMKMNTDFAPI
jgi:Phage replication protein CRI